MSWKGNLEHIQSFPSVWSSQVMNICHYMSIHRRNARPTRVHWIKNLNYTWLYLFTSYFIISYSPLISPARRPIDSYAYGNFNFWLFNQYFYSNQNGFTFMMQVSCNIISCNYNDLPLCIVWEIIVYILS